MVLMVRAIEIFSVPTSVIISIEHKFSHCNAHVGKVMVVLMPPPQVDFGRS